MTTCRVCGQHSDSGHQFEEWVKPTFTDHDLLIPGDIICDDCLFWFDERSEDLAQLVGKDKPQRMRNYSHFVVGGEWMPLSKGDKSRMVSLLTNNPFPELAAIAESGQKHIVFRATRNPLSSKAGWVQFEENSLWVEPNELVAYLSIIEALYNSFSKGEIKTGNYSAYRIKEFGLKQWHALDQQVKIWRGSPLFNLALFLAQKDGSYARNSGRFTGDNLARGTERLQEPIPPHNLGAVREHSQGQRLHQQSREVHQLPMFET